MQLIKRIASTVALCAASLFATQAGAASLLGQTPDASVIVDVGGLEWVYASPCAPGGCSNVQLHDGFTFATDAQWNASFGSIASLVAAFTNADSSTKCASTYFDVTYDHCDIGDAANGYIWHSPLAPDAFHGDHGQAETFLVRGAAVVPEPGSVLLMLSGIAALALVSRRRSNTSL